MQRIRGAALLPAALCLFAAPARADLNDGKPCFTYINPPGAGARYVCTSTSSRTVEHPEEVQVSKAWRTRITARREGEPVNLDLTVDSLSDPLADTAVGEIFANARRLVEGAGYAVDGPRLTRSETQSVREVSFTPVEKKTTTLQISLQSSIAARTLCVGPLFDLAQAPPPLLEAPCGPGATPVTLRAADTSASSPLSDRLDDVHTHTVTDRYASLVVTGDLIVSTYEFVASVELPCTGNHCRSESHHDTLIRLNDSVSNDVWSTRITARFRGGATIFDVTLNSTTSPELDGGVTRALQDARRALSQFAQPDAVVTGPGLVSSEWRWVAQTLLPDTAFLTQSTNLLREAAYSAICVGDLGDLALPTRLPLPPCRNPTWKVTLVDGGCHQFGCIPGYIPVDSLNKHTQRDVYSDLLVTGALTTSHYEYVAEPATKTLVVPIVLSPTGGSAFTSELTLANLGPNDAQTTFAYTPAFGGTAGTVTDTLPGATQKIVPDALAYLRSLGLNDPGAGGFLRMTFEGSAAPDVYASVRTTAAVPEGRVGLAYPALPPSKLFSSSVVLSRLRQNTLDRSNVAVLNAGAPSDGDITLRLTVTSGDSATPMTKALPEVTLPPSGFSQISGVLVSNGLSLSNGIVKVDRVAGTAPFYAYAVVNDQATADGSFIEPLPATPSSPISSATLPVVVETAAYSTELVLTNTSTTSRTLSFTWVAPALTGGRATFSIALLPGEQQILPGFVQLLRDRGAVTNPPGPSFAGALFVSDSSGDLRGVSVSARILSALGGGRAGVALPSVPSGSESNAPVWLCGLQQNGETRSNLALVNVGSTDSSSSDFRIDLYDGATGAKIASPVATVPAKGFTQLDRILAAYAPGVTQGCALVTRTSGANPFIAYAVLNDGAQPGERSGDGAYVASRAVQ